MQFEPRGRRGLRPTVFNWRHPAILSAAALSVASGFAQFSATASLGDIAAAFGEVTNGATVDAQAGLPGTTLGLGMALIRLASLGALPVATLADRHGRRRVLLVSCGIGLAITAAASLSPGFWFFVVIFALGRPMLSGTNAIAGVVAAEETRSVDRAKAMALISASYGVGAGLTALVRGAWGDALGFRGVFALVLVPLALLPLIGRILVEPDRYTALRTKVAQAAPTRPVLGHLRRSLRPRLYVLAVLAFFAAFLTGPVNTMLFVYAESIVGIPRSTVALIVLAAAPVGLVGLLVGRWAADRLGRRPTAAITMTLMAAGGAVTYSGAAQAAIFGYLFTILASSMFSPAIGAMATELFPTSARGTAAGWLTVAGVVGAVTGLVSFGLLSDIVGFEGAALVVAVPVALASVLYFRLPETRGQELEESAPEDPLA